MNLTNYLLRIFGCSLLLFVTSSFGQGTVYQCTVKQLMRVTGNGVLSTAPENVAVSPVGSVFLVDTISGEVQGHTISTNHATDVKIVDRRRGNHFRLMAVIEHYHPTVFFLEIHDLGMLKEEYLFSGYFKYQHIAGICK